MAAGGKRFRPMLTILTARALGYDRDDIYPLACSLEFLHSATLLHDDIPGQCGTAPGKNRSPYRLFQGPDHPGWRCAPGPGQHSGRQVQYSLPYQHPVRRGHAHLRRGDPGNRRNAPARTGPGRIHGDHHRENRLPDPGGQPLRSHPLRDGRRAGAGCGGLRTEPGNSLPAGGRRHRLRIIGRHGRKTRGQGSARGQDNPAPAALPGGPPGRRTQGLWREIFSRHADSRPD